MWASVDGGERIFCGGGQLEWGEVQASVFHVFFTFWAADFAVESAQGDDAWGRLGGMGEGGVRIRTPFL